MRVCSSCASAIDCTIMAALPVAARFKSNLTRVVPNSLKLRQLGIPGVRHFKFAMLLAGGLALLDHVIMEASI